MAVNGGASTTSRSSGRSAIRGRKAAAKTRASPQVMCIFQLPAMTALRTGWSPVGDIRTTLRRRGSVFPAVQTWGQHQHLPSVDRHGITRGQLTAPPGLDRAIHGHVAALDALLGFTAGAHQALPFEELIQLHREGAPGQR